MAKNSSTCLLKVFRNRARGGVVVEGGRWEGGGVVAYEYNCRFNWEVEGGLLHMNITVYSTKIIITGHKIVASFFLQRLFITS